MTAQLLPSGRVLSLSRFDRSLRQDVQQCLLDELVFIDAYGLVGTTCAISAARIHGTPVDVSLPVNEATRDHLAAMGFGRALEEAGSHVVLGAPDAEHQDVVVPLRRAGSSSGAQAVSELLWSQLEPHVGAQILGALTEGVWEMVANAQEHSGADGWVMGQVYRRGEPPDHDDKVQVVIGDAGKGIRGSFADGGTTWTDDLSAIEAALEYLVSSVDDPGRGQGLNTTMEQVTGLDGKMVVRSGTGRVTIDSRTTVAEVVPHLSGVLVALCLPID